ncbi:MAG: DUF4256 domain-containing protein [Sphingobacteriales bacterium]|nr:MAG: DUF4256 domain-containing protein [Sphingobacteriales bacterium]
MKAPERDALLAMWQKRFEQNMRRHPGLDWAEVASRLLQAKPQKLKALQAMEDTGGEPDVIGRDDEGGGFVFCDCAAESPKGRRSVCYDAQALAARKEHKPQDSALGMAANLGIELLTEEQYLQLQALGDFDTKTSSWVLTPPEVRSLGGAIFCDKRYGRVFTYHNGAESYYGARGFRGLLRV